MSIVHASRLRPFRLLWTASTISSLGDGVHWIALPLLAASATADPRLISLVTVADHLPWLLFGLVSGALADRIDRRRAMWLADLVRAGIVGVFTVLVLTGAATLPIILAVAFVLTSVGTLRDSAAASFLPSIVAPADRPRANGRLSAGMLVTDTLLGAPLGALLFAAVAGAPFLVDTASFAVAALLVAAIPVAAPRPARPASTLRADVLSGVRFVLGHRLQRWLCLYGALSELVTTVVVALLVLYTTRLLHLGSLGYGLLVAAFAVGGVGGSLLGGRLTRLVGYRAAFLLAVALAAVSFTGVAASTTAPGAGVAVAGYGAASGLWGVVSVSVRQLVVPEELLGRVTSAARLVALGAGPVGALVAGVVAHRYGLRLPLVGGAVLLAVAALAAPVLLPRADFPAANAR